MEAVNGFSHIRIDPPRDLSLASMSKNKQETAIVHSAPP